MRIIAINKQIFIFLILCILAIVLPLVHIPGLMIVDAHLDFILIYTQIIFSGPPLLIILLALSLIKDLLRADLLLISFLSYTIFCYLAVFFVSHINKKHFVQIWLCFIASFIVAYTIPILVKAFLLQILTFNYLFLVELASAAMVFPLCYTLLKKCYA